MRQRKELTSQEKVNQILAAVNKNLQYTLGGTKQQKVFNGKIGEDVTFIGQISGNYNRGKFYNPRAQVYLSDSHQNDIAIILMKYAGSLVRFADLYNKTGSPYHHIDTGIVVPTWANIGIKTDLTNSGQEDQLHVFHSKNETAADVINNIYNVVQRSLAKENIVKKLKVLNLPNLKLRAAAENFVNMLYNEAEQNQSQDNTREK